MKWNRELIKEYEDIFMNDPLKGLIRRLNLFKLDNPELQYSESSYSKRHSFFPKSNPLKKNKFYDFSDDDILDYISCVKSESYFFNLLMYMEPFKDRFDKFDWMLESMSLNKTTHITKARQIGITTFLMLKSWYHLIFRDEFRICFITNRLDDSMEKFKGEVSKIPYHLRPVIKNSLGRRLVLNNRSMIDFKRLKNLALGMNYNLYIIDDFIGDDIRDLANIIVVSNAYSLSGSKVIISSSPNETLRSHIHSVSLYSVYQKNLSLFDVKDHNFDTKNILKTFGKKYYTELLGLYEDDPRFMRMYNLDRLI